MTKKQLDNLSSMSLQQALLRAFDAGCSYGIASHIDFVQNQPDRTTVCDTLLKLYVRIPLLITLTPLNHRRF
jgi:hypothetical protein